MSDADRTSGASRIVAVLLAGFMAGLVGCATKPSATNAEAALAQAAPVASAPYVLQPGDLIDVKFFYEPTLDESVRIRPDGRISLMLVDEVQAAGKTPEQLDELLTKRYASVLKRSEVTVIVREFSAQKVFVGGEVASPRVLPLNGELTALQAVFEAGGFRETAQTSSVIVISRGSDGRPVSRKVNLKKAMKGDEDVVLRPYDVVYVPKTFVAAANKFVEQYITKMIPVNLSAGFNYTLYKGTQTGSIRTTPTP